MQNGIPFYLYYIIMYLSGFQVVYDFERGFDGWIQSTTDDADFDRHIGATPSWQTGPDYDENGNVVNSPKIYKNDLLM